MYRYKVCLLFSCVVMLTGCVSNANTSEDIEPKQPEVYVVETDSEIGVGESDADEISEATEQMVGSEGANDTFQPGNPAEDSAEVTGADESDETDTIYLKPCNIYQDILDNAYTVITNRLADIVVADEIFIYDGIREAGIGRSTDEALAGIGYTFYDVDGNGIEELIIADMLDNDGGPWDNRILLMYSLADDNPVLVIDGWARNRYYLLNNGTIYNEGSGGAAYTIFATYRIAEDGISLEVIDYYSSGYYGDSEWGWFHSTTGVTTEDESEIIEFENDDVPWEMMENYMAQVKQLDLTFFETLRP